MKKRLLILLTALFCFSLSAQWDVVEERFIPPAYYVGDSVLLQFRLVLNDEALILEIPELLPREEWLEIESVEIERDGYDALVSIRFRSFQTGTRTLPLLTLGDVELDSLKIFTTSLAEENEASEIIGIRDSLDVPGIKIIIALFIVCIVAMPYLLALLLRIAADRMTRLVRWLGRSGPRRRIRRLVKKLEQRIDDSGQEKDFYIDLSRELRLYLSRRNNRDYSSMTTRDMAAMPGCGNSSLWSDVIKVLRLGDMAKFAGQRVNRKDKVWSLNVLKELITSLEKEENGADL